MPICEGCGTRADEAHTRRRTQRAELSRRFRPAHLRVLFLDGAPPARIEDYFYHAAIDRSVRSVASRAYFDQLLKCLAVPPRPGTLEEAALADFQRGGFFLTSALECPFEEQTDPQNALRRSAPSAVKKVQALDPSYIVPISPPTQELIRLFGLIGWGDRLVLHNGGPFVDPYLGDPAKQAIHATAFGEPIRKILAAFP
jgi:hypothetical protein